MAGLLVREVEEPDADGDYLVADLDVLGSQACSVNRCPVTSVDATGGLRSFGNQRCSVLTPQREVNVAVVFVDRRGDSCDDAIDGQLPGDAAVLRGGGEGRVSAFSCFTVR